MKRLSTALIACNKGVAGTLERLHRGEIIAQLRGRELIETLVLQKPNRDSTLSKRFDRLIPPASVRCESAFTLAWPRPERRERGPNSAHF